MIELSAPGRAWCALAALLGLLSVAAWAAPAVMLDWQPARAWHDPWRWWTAAFVHWSPLHLGANLLGTAVVAAFGWAGRVPGRIALAWLLAWPLGHGALLIQPALAHYGGLSGVLHAGVAASAVALLRDPQRSRRHVAAAVLAGLTLKIVLEAPWGPPLRAVAGWDIAVAPLAHATGALTGVVMALLVGRGRPRPSSP